ncbi:hypothetical protein K440DRAFT_614017 [Wilcoxina mikolae CBS 423.85]|nr:hypothetical protein K440DRAFT_614017 [Wilcoxina mikolae CBS 423.85]
MSHESLVRFDLEVADPAKRTLVALSRTALVAPSPSSRITSPSSRVTSPSSRVTSRFSRRASPSSPLTSSSPSTTSTPGSWLKSTDVGLPSAQARARFLSFP